MSVSRSAAAIPNAPCLPLVSYSGQCDDEAMTTDAEPALVPESLVANLDDSIEFWCGLCGFTVLYSRPDERFAYIASGSAHLMLEPDTQSDA